MHGLLASCYCRAQKAYRNPAEAVRSDGTLAGCKDGKQQDIHRFLVKPFQSGKSSSILSGKLITLILTVYISLKNKTNGDEKLLKSSSDRKRTFKPFITHDNRLAQRSQPHYKLESNQ
jgi:hypothetical protein